MPYDYTEFEQVQVVERAQEHGEARPGLVCALCGGTERWQDRGVSRCTACAHRRGSWGVVIPLACHTCGSVSRPERQAYPDGSVLYRCGVCHRPRACHTIVDGASPTPQGD